MNAVQQVREWLPHAGGSDQAPFFLLAGPCAIEDTEAPHQVAETVSALCRQHGIPYIFKGSYRKANRTRGDSFTGIGDREALEILGHIRKTYGVATVTDIHESHDAAIAAEFVDVLQIPAFLCRQTELLLAAGATGKVVNIKKGQFVSADVMAFAADKVKAGGSNKVLLTERGTTFGYQDLIVDYRNIPWMQESGWPVVMDVTHALQQPNQGAGVTSGRPQLIKTIASAAAAVGVDGFFIEVHPEPSRAKSDASNMLKLELLPELLEHLVRVSKAAKGL